MSWYRELPQSQRLLMVAIYKRLTVTELAVLTILVNQAGRMGLRHMSALWNGELLERLDRKQGHYPLPYTKQGIWKAVNALEARGWLQKVCGYRSDRDPELRVLPINILAEAPSWLRSQDPASTPVDETPAVTVKVRYYGGTYIGVVLGMKCKASFTGGEEGAAVAAGRKAFRQQGLPALYVKAKRLRGLGETSYVSWWTVETGGRHA